MTENEAMENAIQEAYDGIKAGDGGPFGAVVVKDGNIVGRGHNRVIKNQDATCHGELEAIRDACRNLGTFDLSGCEIYTTSEPCPMCLGAILWANINRVYQGCNIQDAEAIGFRDKRFYDHLQGNSSLLTVTELNRTGCKELFNDYKNLEDKKEY